MFVIISEIVQRRVRLMIFLGIVLLCNLKTIHIFNLFFNLFFDKWPWKTQLYRIQPFLSNHRLDCSSITASLLHVKKKIQERIDCWDLLTQRFVKASANEISSSDEVSFYENRLKLIKIHSDGTNWCGETQTLDCRMQTRWVWAMRRIFHSHFSGLLGGCEEEEANHWRSRLISHLIY